MAVIDELCSGTNPTEGEEIAEMVISMLPKLHPQVFISTHFLGLAQKLERVRSVERLDFLQVELDNDYCPTFGFVAGAANTGRARDPTLPHKVGYCVHSVQSLEQVDLSTVAAEKTGILAQ